MADVTTKSAVPVQPHL